MKTKFPPLAFALALAALSGGCSSSPTMSASPDGYQLEKVVMLSRHGIRAPLIGYGSALAESTPYTWPQWQTEGGHLTPKGAELETIFARWLDGWFDANGLIKGGECPADKVLVYTNSLPRTIDSGKSFVAGAFPNCEVPVHHLEEVGKMDNTFNPITRSATDDAFVARAAASVDDLLGAGGFAGLNRQLAANYAALETVLDFDNSVMCKEKKQCDFAAQDNTLTFESGKEPKTGGALRNGTGAGDSFILQYYEGFPEKDVAWGRLQSPQSWQQVIDIKNRYNDVLFGTPVMAKEAATPLLTFIANALQDRGYQHPLGKAAQEAKIVLLVGHDSNFGSLFPLLQVAPYQLPGQYEHTPISGKVAFEQWRDRDGKGWMKIEYLYQTGEQLRHATALDAKNPPQRVTLQIAGCAIDAQGFCPLDDFHKAVERALQ